MRHVLVAGWIIAATAGVAWAQVPAGGEFIVNSYTTGYQVYASTGRDARGNFVVVWDARSPVFDVRGQRFDRAGVRVGAELAVATGFALSGSVAMAPAGNFVVLWTEYGASADVFGRRYDANGNPAGAVFAVNTYTTGPQYYGQAAFDGRGNFVVTWWDNGRDGNGWGVFAQRFDARNERLGAEFQVNTYTTGSQNFNSLAVDSAGNFIIAWTDVSDGSFLSANARIFDPSGSPVGSEFLIGATTTGDQGFPAPMYAPDGTILIAFVQQDFNNRGVAARRFSASGSPLGSQFQVNTYTTGLQGYPWLDIDSAGNYVVQWTDFLGDGFPSRAIKARRYSAADVPRSGEFLVNTYTTGDQMGHRMAPAVASDPVGNFVITWESPQDGSATGIVARRFGGIHPQSMQLFDTGNGVLEPGEAVDVTPTWFNASGAAQTLGGLLTNMTGPAGPIYTINDGSANYGTIANNASGACTGCYTVFVSNPPTRPVLHWDAAATETLTPDTQGQAMRWKLHVGNSFTDVPTSSPFYRFIETLLHHDITGGCTASTYCPVSNTTREQMAVFVLVAKEGPGFTPPACLPPNLFADVPETSPFCRWVEELARRGVVTGCGGNNYCPTLPVTREQMATFVLVTLDPTLNPPACVPPNLFNDVSENSPFCRWIEELANRGVVTGCGGGNYCPTAPVTREQMGAFISVTFGLTLYGP